ncbi:MAG: hypothetical protein ABF868_07830 [Sporolactobacillus sp.]
MTRFFYLLAIFSYILTTLLPHRNLLNALLSLACLLAVVASFRRAHGLAFLFGFSFIAGGTALLMLNHKGLWSIALCFGNMIQLVTLFALIPILALPVQSGGYAGDVRGFIRSHVRGSGRLYVLTSCVAYFFSSFMNLAALPLSYRAIAPSVQETVVPDKKRYLSRAITHGYAMPLLWSPITPIVGTVLELTSTPYTRILPFLIALSAIGLLIDWLTGLPLVHLLRSSTHAKKSTNETAAAAAPTGNYSMFRLLHIVLAVLILNGLVTALQHELPVSFLFLVSLLVIPFAGCWSLLIGQVRSFSRQVGQHFLTYIPTMQNQFFIFLSAGFFITALHISGADHTVTGWMNEVIAFSGTRGFLALLPLIPFALAFFGLHPAVALALVSTSIHSEILHQAPVAVTVAMLGGAVPAFLMGPYNATLGMMSGLVGEKPLRLSNWNFKFTVAYLAGLTLFIQLLYIAFNS